MKLLVLMDCYDYESEFVSAIFRVPDDCDQQELRKQYNEETLVPATGRNQYGEWKSKVYGRNTIQFHDWLREKFEMVEFETLW